jgi:hypothetical protein
MKYLLYGMVILALASAEALGDMMSLQGALVNSSTAGVIDPIASGTPGLTGTLDAATGLGTITFTDTKPGVGFFHLFVDVSLATPFFNEFGATGGGTPAAGQGWQIDVPDYWCNTPACQSLGLPIGSPDPNDPGANIIANLLANSLNNQNGVPGMLSNFLNDCGAEPNAISPAQNPVGRRNCIRARAPDTAESTGYGIVKVRARATTSRRVPAKADENPAVREQGGAGTESNRGHVARGGKGSRRGIVKLDAGIAAAP